MALKKMARISLELQQAMTAKMEQVSHKNVQFANSLLVHQEETREVVTAAKVNLTVFPWIFILGISFTLMYKIQNLTILLSKW